MRLYVRWGDGLGNQLAETVKRKGEHKVRPYKDLSFPRSRVGLHQGTLPRPGSRSTFVGTCR
jgi:hypothetical protein